MVVLIKIICTLLYEGYLSESILQGRNDAANSQYFENATKS
jgi:hypothetical protein